MSISNKINGVWRDVWSTHVRINGVWRNADVIPNVNGVWRNTYVYGIQEKNILGFRMVYKLSSNKRHPDFPQLTVNHHIPTNMSLTGNTHRMLDKDSKGVIFEYYKESPEEEGIKMYEGNLYAILDTDQLVMVSSVSDDIYEDARVPTDIPGITEAWNSSRIPSDINIEINGHVSYESYGYYLTGWNSLFNTNQLLNDTNFPDRGPGQDFQQIKSYIILPSTNRDPNYFPTASIGIARNVTSDKCNMVGSYGYISHTINSILINGTPKSFVIEIYN